MTSRMCGAPSMAGRCVLPKGHAGDHEAFAHIPSQFPYQWENVNRVDTPPTPADNIVVIIALALFLLLCFTAGFIGGMIWLNCCKG